MDFNFINMLMTFKLTSPPALKGHPYLTHSLTARIRNIKHCLSLNFLKLNNNKTEKLINSPATSVKRVDLSFDIDEVHVLSFICL